jgi:hypothetical protein
MYMSPDAQSERPAENEATERNDTHYLNLATALDAAPISAGPTPLPS